MIVYDAHCHLEAVRQINSPRPLAVAAVNLQDIIKLDKYRQQNNLAKIGIGIHPWFIDPEVELINYQQQLIAIIETYQPDFIGECGLDYNKPHFESQQLLCELHCQLAQHYQLPIIFHCVRAYNQLLQIIARFPTLKGMLHGFNSNSEMARQLAKKNISLGIGSLVTNPNTQIYKSVTKLPLEFILVESDSPFMPMTGQEYSTPDDCLTYATAIANQQQKTQQEITCRVNANWIKLFS